MFIGAKEEFAIFGEPYCGDGSGISAKGSFTNDLHCFRIPYNDGRLCSNRASDNSFSFRTDSQGNDVVSVAIGLFVDTSAKESLFKI